MYDYSFTNSVDTSLVTNPAPQQVYQSYAEAATGVGNITLANMNVTQSLRRS